MQTDLTARIDEARRAGSADELGNVCARFHGADVFKAYRFRVFEEGTFEFRIESPAGADPVGFYLLLGTQRAGRQSGRRAAGDGVILGDGRVEVRLLTLHHRDLASSACYRYRCSSGVALTYNGYAIPDRVGLSSWGGNSGMIVEQLDSASFRFRCSSSHFGEPDFSSLVYCLTFRPP